MAVSVERRDGVALVRMDDGRVNAMDLALCKELAGTVRGLAGETGVRAVVLTGNGRAFSAGADLRALVTGRGPHARAFVAGLADCFEAVLSAPLPVVAAVDGHALAGGCVLACAADHRVVVDDPAALLGLTEMAVGVPFSTVALEVVRWRVGDGPLGRRVLLAGTVPAPEAVAAGLADETAPADRLLDRALEVAARLGALPAGVFALTKEQLQADVRARTDARAPGQDARVADLWASEPVLEAVEVFVGRTLRRG